MSTIQLIESNIIKFFSFYFSMREKLRKNFTKSLQILRIRLKCKLFFALPENTHINNNLICQMRLFKLEFELFKMIEEVLIEMAKTSSLENLY